MRENYIGFAIIASQRAAHALASGDGRTALVAAHKAIALGKGSEDKNALRGLLIERAKANLFLGNFDRALADVEEAIAARKVGADPGAPSAALARAYLVLGQILSKQDKPAEAREAFAIALRNFETTVGPDHPSTKEARQGAQNLH